VLETSSNTKFFFDTKADREILYPKMSLSQKKGAIWMLLSLSEDDHLPYGAPARLARTFSVHKSTIERSRDRACHARATGLCNSPEICSLLKGDENALKYPIPMLQEAIRDIPIENRSTQRQLAFSLVCLIVLSVESHSFICFVSLLIQIWFG
jgi:hypothetical protein